MVVVVVQLCLTIVFSANDVFLISIRNIFRDYDVVKTHKTRSLLAQHQSKIIPDALIKFQMELFVVLL